MKAKEKINFSKFFPLHQQFVVVRGEARSPTDFDLDVTIGDGDEKASFYFGPFGSKESLEMMKTMRDAMQQALEFYEKTMKLPLIKGEDNDFFSMVWDNDEKPKKKKAAVKK